MVIDSITYILTNFGARVDLTLLLLVEHDNDKSSKSYCLSILAKPR